MTESLFNINGKDIKYFENDIQWDKDEVTGGVILPVLFTTNKHGNNVFWRIYVIDNKIFREMKTGDDGKLRVFPEIECNGKNIGRKNENF